MKISPKKNDVKKNGQVLVCVPRTNDGGGANYFNSLKDLFSHKVVYFYRGKPNWPESSGFIHELLRLINDYIFYLYILMKWDYKVVHINTFFGGKGVYRDAVFILFARIIQKKIIVSFRGWNWHFSGRENSRLLQFIKNIYLKADALIILSSKEKNKLRSWGYNKLIFSETTTVDERLVSGMSINNINEKYDGLTHLNLLFLSRIHKEKGIYELLHAFQNIRKKFPTMQLTIAGQGPEFGNIKRYISDHKLDRINLTGFVSGAKKIAIFKNAHIFLFPSYSEGMPNAVLEAFAFGLPVVATKVGGLKDIFKDHENGLVVEIKNSTDLKEKLEKLITNNDLMKQIALTNYNYARERFLSNVVVQRLEKIYDCLLRE